MNCEGPCPRDTRPPKKMKKTACPQSACSGRSWCLPSVHPVGRAFVSCLCALSRRVSGTYRGGGFLAKRQIKSLPLVRSTRGHGFEKDRAATGVDFPILEAVPRPLSKPCGGPCGGAVMDGARAQPPDGDGEGQKSLRRSQTTSPTSPPSPARWGERHPGPNLAPNLRQPGVGFAHPPVSPPTASH